MVVGKGDWVGEWRSTSGRQPDIIDDTISKEITIIFNDPPKEILMSLDTLRVPRNLMKKIIKLILLFSVIFLVLGFFAVPVAIENVFIWMDLTSY